MAITRPAVFLDTDGTFILGAPDSCDPSRITLSPGAGEALRALGRAGFSLIVVSNQSSVAGGLFREAALAGVTARLRRLLAVEGVALAAAYYCCHDPEAALAAYRVNCRCRKPAPGMLEAAAAEHGIALEQSWMVGGVLDDVCAGKAAGARTVFLDNGNETEWRLAPERVPHHIAKDLRGCADTILSSAGSQLRGVAA